MAETNSDIPNDINHIHYRFAYDLVEKVLDIRGELNPYVSHNLPEPQKYIFTKEHAAIIKVLLDENRTYLLKQVHKIANCDYNLETYKKCREFFVDEWVKTTYTEESFIRACASVAYVAAFFTQVNFQCGALDEVIKFIAGWIGHILKNGTIDNSHW